MWCYPVLIMEELPEPASGQFLEISFRRLLKSCEEIIKGDNKMRPDLDDWQTSPVFHHVCSQTFFLIVKELFNFVKARGTDDRGINLCLCSM